VISRCIFFLVLSPLLASCGSQYAATPAGRQDPASGRPKAVFPQAGFEFGEVLSGTVVEHDFALRNAGSRPARIEKVSMTTPLLVTQMPREIAPGEENRIHFKLDTANLEGKFAGTILVFSNDPEQPQTRLSFSGRIVPAIEIRPRPAFFLAGQRGQGNRAALDIVNHEEQPLRIEKVEHPSERFTTQLETLKPGQHYRLTLALKPGGPGGRASGTILIRTSSKKMPELKIGANTYLYERVHAFPDFIDFGTWRAGEAAAAAVTMMIHQEGGSNFEARLSSDVPGLQLKAERGPKGDRYQVEITLLSQQVKVGPIKGSIFINTNDPQFPKILVPVSGQIER
jgi:uncharacterized protein DUF1573